MKNFQNCSKQWEIWHNSGINPEIVVNIQDQILQFDLVSKITKLSSAHSYSIIEIGPFNGTLCKQILSVYSNNIKSYTLIDNVKMLENCKNNLKNFQQVIYCTIENIDKLVNTKYNLFISNHCLSETTIDYQNYVFNNFFKNCNEVFILDNINPSKQFFVDDINDYKYIERISDVLKKLNHTMVVSNGHKLSRLTQKLIYSYE